MIVKKVAVFSFLGFSKTKIKKHMTTSCFYCDSTNIVKNGKTYYGEQRHLCKDCKRQFIQCRKYFKLTIAQKEQISALLLERISLEGILRFLKISAYHLYTYMDKLYGQTLYNLNISTLISHSKEIDLQCFECENDEAWSFVGHKSNKQWIWIAIHRQSRMVVGLFIGSRGKVGAEGLWESIPEEIKKNAIFHTDDWDSYKEVFKQSDHRPSKQKKETNHIERFWATLRQRCSRLVRLSLSFSKKQSRHEGAIWYFVYYYNLQKSLLL
jgi:insertion element IS1 protein InsB